MSDEIGNIILKELKEMRTEINGLETGINGIKNEIDGIKTEINGIKTEINGIKNEIDGIKTEIDGIKTEINGLKTELNGLREEVNRRFDILENELARNSEQHVVMNGEIKEIKDRLTRIEKEQEVAKRRDEQLATELKAEDALIIDCQKRSLINKYDIEQVKEKLAV